MPVAMLVIVADFPWRQLRYEGFPRLADSGKRAVENVLEALRFHGHGAFFGLGFSRFVLACVFSSSATPCSSAAR